MYNIFLLTILQAIESANFAITLLCFVGDPFNTFSARTIADTTSNLCSVYFLSETKFC